MKKIILFDLDGTLTDPVEGITNSVRFALGHFGIEENDREKLKKFIGPPLVGAFEEYCGLTNAQAKTALQKFRVYFEKKGIFENRLYPGTKETLAALKKRGFTLAVASSKPELYVKRILAHFGIDVYFDFVGGSDMEETRAEKSAVIAYVLEKLGSSDAKNCVMVGDRSHDVVGARENKINCVGVLFGCGSREELEGAGALALARDMRELEEILAAYFTEKR